MSLPIPELQHQIINEIVQNAASMDIQTETSETRSIQYILPKSFYRMYKVNPGEEPVIQEKRQEVPTDKGFTVLSEWL